MVQCVRPVAACRAVRRARPLRRYGEAAAGAERQTARLLPAALCCVAADVPRRDEPQGLPHRRIPVRPAARPLCHHRAPDEKGRSRRMRRSRGAARHVGLRHLLCGCGPTRVPRLLGRGAPLPGGPRLPLRLLARVVLLCALELSAAGDGPSVPPAQRRRSRTYDQYVAPPRFYATYEISFSRFASAAARLF